MSSGNYGNVTRLRVWNISKLLPCWFTNCFKGFKTFIRKQPCQWEKKSIGRWQINSDIQVLAWLFLQAKVWSEPNFKKVRITISPRVACNWLTQAFPLAIFFTPQDFENAEKLSFFFEFWVFSLSFEFFPWVLSLNHKFKS